MSGLSESEREAVAELLSWVTGEFTRYVKGAHPDHNRWSWKGDGHGDVIRDEFRAMVDSAEGTLVAIIAEREAAARVAEREAILHEVWLRIHERRFDGSDYPDGRPDYVSERRAVNTFYAGVSKAEFVVSDIASEHGIDDVRDALKMPMRDEEAIAQVLATPPGPEYVPPRARAIVQSGPVSVPGGAVAGLEGSGGTPGGSEGLTGAQGGSADHVPRLHRAGSRMTPEKQWWVINGQSLMDALTNVSHGLSTPDEAYIELYANSTTEGDEK